MVYGLFMVCHKLTNLSTSHIWSFTADRVRVEIFQDGKIIFESVDIWSRHLIWQCDILVSSHQLAASTMSPLTFRAAAHISSVKYHHCQSLSAPGGTSISFTLWGDCRLKGPYIGETLMLTMETLSGSTMTKHFGTGTDGHIFLLRRSLS